jgi:hypothetical protein
MLSVLNTSPPSVTPPTPILVERVPQSDTNELVDGIRNLAMAEGGDEARACRDVIKTLPSRYGLRHAYPNSLAELSQMIVKAAIRKSKHKHGTGHSNNRLHRPVAMPMRRTASAPTLHCATTLPSPNKRVEAMTLEERRLCVAQVLQGKPDVWGVSKMSCVQVLDDEAVSAGITSFDGSAPMW